MFRPLRFGVGHSELDCPDETFLRNRSISTAGYGLVVAVRIMQQYLGDLQRAQFTR
jgi:hypothetical protein